MAKAALNMMTLTSAREFALSSIFMTAVDTGWVTDELPIPKQGTFSTPIDEEDGASRVLDPIFSYLNADPKPPTPLHGVFLKDYKESTW
jgi:NAD(P)-dependent dehydrogenase (short-subunit alcohol dehydrogenase family)